MTTTKTYLGINFSSEVTDLDNHRPTDLMVTAWFSLNPNAETYPSMAVIASALKDSGWNSIDIVKDYKFAYTFTAQKG